MYLSIALCLPLCSTQPLDSPSQIVARLAGSEPDAAIELLVALEPAQTLHLLVTCVREQPVAYAWQAGRALQRIAETHPADKAWKETSAALGAVLLDSAAKAESRLVAGIALRGLEKHAKPLFEDIAQSLAKEAPASAHLGATLALAGLGDKALGELKDVMKGEGLRKMMWGATAIACADKDGKALKATLVKLVEDEESLTAYLACRSNIDALQLIAGSTVADKSLEKRNERRKSWSGGKRINFGGVVMIGVDEVKNGATMLADATKHKLTSIEDVSLPEQIGDPAGGNKGTLGALMQALTSHLTQEVRKLAGRLEAREFTTYDKWNEASSKLLALAELLDSVEPFIPTE